MTGFPTRALGDFCKVQSGFAFKSKDWQDEGVPVVQIANVKPRFLDLSSTKFVSAQVAETAHKFRLRDGDILISMTGHIGSVARKLGDQHVMLNQRVGRIENIDKSVIEPRFLFEMLQSAAIRQRLVQLGYGAAQPNISPKLIGSVEIPLPPLDAQRRIAAILGVYDDLIEVNRRRAAVLEEMARGLYEEWFVRFRFPGHETKAVAQTSFGPLPAGWSFEELGTLADVQWGDTKTTKKSYVQKGGYPAYSAAGQDGLLDHFDYERTGIVVSAIGSVGRTWLARGRWSCIKNTIRFIADSSKASDEYLFLATQGSERWPTRGAAQPFISLGDARKVRVICPDPTTMQRFTAFARPALELSFVLGQQNTRLGACRDLLLPRLISGQLSVGAAELELGEAA